MRIFVYGIIGPTLSAFLAMWGFSVAFGNGESVSSAMGPMFAVFWILLLIPSLMVFAIQRLLIGKSVLLRAIVSSAVGFAAALGMAALMISIFQMKEGNSPAILFGLAGGTSAVVCSLLLAFTNKAFRSVARV